MKGLSGSLARVPGAVVVAVWVALLLGGFGVAVLVDGWEVRDAALQLAREAENRERPSELDNFLDRVAPRLEPEEARLQRDSLAAARAERVEELMGARRWMRVGALSAAAAWLLVFGFAVFGTGRWVAEREGWLRVQTWHGGKLLTLYVAFVSAAFLYALSVIPFSRHPSGATFLTTSALILLAGGAMLLRASWNWLTGRETRRESGSTTA